MLRVIALYTAALAAGAATCPNPPRPLLSPEVPPDVCIPDPFNALTINFFDDYSWRAFTAMVWPATRNQRGAADPARAIGAPGPRVFETFKSLWEVFHDDGSAPTAAFNDYDSAAANTCKATARFGDIVLAASTPYGDIGQAGIGELTGPLVAQNGHYVRYQTLYNQIAYDYIVRNRFYLRDHLPPIPSPRPDVPVLQFPVGSIAIKAAWLDVRGLSRELLPRLYKRAAIARDPETGDCAPVTVALIGLHIVQKTPTRPQWIWSSFEQVDTAPSSPAPSAISCSTTAARVHAGRKPAPAAAACQTARQALQRGPLLRHLDSSQHARRQQRLARTAERHGVAELPPGGHAVAAAGRQPGPAGSALENG